MKELLVALRLTEFVLAGHSLGGSIQLDFDLRYPGIRGLIRVGRSANWDVKPRRI